MSDDRNLTDADAKKVAEEFYALAKQDFYQDVGKGVWGWFKKALVALFLLAVAYGILNDGRLLNAAVAVGR